MKEEQTKLVNCEKSIASLMKEADTLALNARRKSKIDLIRQSNEKRKLATSFLENSQNHKVKILRLEHELANLEE